MENKALVLTSKDAAFELLTLGIPTPGPNEVVVKNHAVAINPINILMHKFGFRVPSYPCVIGSDISGVIHSIGSSVTNVKPGDRVAGFSIAGQPHQGAFQTFPTLYSHAITKLPHSITFNEGAILPMAVATSAVGIFLHLNIPWGAAFTKQEGIFLMTGASSSVGSAAVQIASILGFEVFATASEKNFETVRGWGAKEVWDYKDPEIVSKIAEAAGGKGIKCAFSAISMYGSASLAARILSAANSNSGSREKAQICVTTPWEEKEPVPEGIEVSMTGATNAFMVNEEFGAWLFNEFLQDKLESEEFVPSPGMEVVDGGLEKGVVRGMERYGEGVSGLKVVVPLVQ